MSVTVRTACPCMMIRMKIYVAANPDDLKTHIQKTYDDAYSQDQFTLKGVYS